MLAFAYSPLYFFETWLLAFMLCRWIKACIGNKYQKPIKIFVYIIFIFAALAMPIGFLLPASKAKNAFQHYGCIWLGVLMYAGFPTLCYLAFCLVWRIHKLIKGSNESLERPRKVAITAATVSIIFVTIICTYGMLHATDTRITDYTIEVQKGDGKLDSLNAVLIADTHMGYNIGCKEMQRMADLINECEPDIVFFAGDIFDNSYDALDDPEKLIEIYKSIKTKYGIYACYGNHDVDEAVLAGFTFNYSGKKESDPRMDDFLERAGIKLLMDEGELIADSFYVYGRPDLAKPGRGITERKTPLEIMEDVPEGYPVIVLDHEPDEVRVLAAAGVDVALCGHTHDGQVFPANLLVKLVFDNSYGYKKFGDMDSVVTSGVGLFGPFMRVGTISEICNIKIKFTP